MKYLLSLLLILSSNILVAVPPDANITDVVLNELLFNPHDLTPVSLPNDGQDCNGDGSPGQDGSTPAPRNAEDEFIEFYNNGATDVDLEGYCLSANPITVGTNVADPKRRWLIPAGVIVPAGGFYHICGDNGSGLGFSIVDTNGDEIEQYSNSPGTNGRTPSLYEPTISGDCSSMATAVIFSVTYDGALEGNGESFLRCFTDGTDPLGYYADSNGFFYRPTPGSANCITATPVHVNHIQYSNQLITWQSSLEFNHIGFNVYASQDGKRLEKLNDKLIASNDLKQYSFSLKSKQLYPELLLTAVDNKGVEERLDFIKNNQVLGSKEFITAIDWEKTSQTQHNIAKQRSSLDYINVLVDKSGIQKISVQKLANNGMNIVGVSSLKVSLSHANKNIPFYNSSQNKEFSINDYIVFIGKQADSMYSDKNIYTLSLANASNTIKPIKAAPVKGQAFADFYIATEIFEENNYYDISSVTNDAWMMKKMLTYEEVNSQSWQFNLPHLSQSRAADNQKITFTANLNGATDFLGATDDHHIEFQVNGKATVSAYFDGQESVALVNELANRNFSENIELSLIQAGDTGYAYDLVNLDKFIVQYPHTFTASDGILDFKSDQNQFRVKGFTDDNIVILAENNNKTSLLLGANITAQHGQIALEFINRVQDSHVYISQWNEINTPALLNSSKPQLDATDYLIITQSDFQPFLIDYVNSKQSQGLKVTVVDVNSIYAHYGQVANDPDAIKAYIQTLNGIKPLSYVMLVGSDQYDYKNYLDTQAYSIVPTFYRHTGDGIHHAPTDTPFVDLDNDNVADIAIGRLTVNNSDELVNVLNKIQNYQSQEHKNELFITDNVDVEIFNSMTERLSSNTQNDVQIIDTGVVGIEQANNDLIDALNNGTDYVNWIGHSSPTRWSRDNVFDIDDVDTLENSPAIFYQLGCWNSYFVDPVKQNLANALLQKADFGAVATIGSSTYTKTDGEISLAQYFKGYINNNENPTIGKALNYAFKQYSILNPDRKDILLGYQLLGDPSMLVK